MHVTRSTPVGEIVAADFRTAAVFHEFGIDFCCGGRRPLGDACQARQVDPDQVLDAVVRACSTPGSAPRFDDWSLDTLVGYIVGEHHAFVRHALPSLVAHARKIASVHGGRHPELHEIAGLVEGVATEMVSHMAKEEHVLFPFIVSSAEAAASGRPQPHPPFGSIDNPIRMMEEEHESAGAAMARIRELTDGYRVPDDGCTTYRVCLQGLDAFERDLHAHVHLENNILFPKARALASSVTA